MTNTELAIPATYTFRPGYVRSFDLLTEEELPYFRDAVAEMFTAGFHGVLSVSTTFTESAASDYYACVVEFEGSAFAARTILALTISLHDLINAEG